MSYFAETLTDFCCNTTAACYLTKCSTFFADTLLSAVSLDWILQQSWIYQHSYFTSRKYDRQVYGAIVTCMSLCCTTFAAKVVSYFSLTKCIIQFCRDDVHSNSKVDTSSAVDVASRPTQGGSDVISMPAGFRRHLVGKTLIYVFSLWYHWNTLCHQANDHTHIFINQRIECYLNNTINRRRSTPHIMPCYTHKMAIVSWP